MRESDILLNTLLDKEIKKSNDIYTDIAPKVRLDTNLIMSRKLNIDDYDIEAKPTNDISLTDNVVIFHSGSRWRIIKLSVMLQYPVLYSKYWNINSEQYMDITLVVCPITLRSFIFRDKIEIVDILENKTLVLKKISDNEDKIFYLGIPYIINHDDESANSENVITHIKRNEVKIMTLRDTFLFATDSDFIVLKDTKKKSLLETVISLKYYENKSDINNNPIDTIFHPKTLVYIIQYYSTKSMMYKQTVLINKDISKTRITGYSYKRTGIWEYLSMFHEDFKKKNAVIFPILWYMVDILYPNSKVVLLE